MNCKIIFFFSDRYYSFITIDDTVRDEKLQYDIDSKAAKISAFSSEKNQYEYLRGEEISCSNQNQMIKHVKFTHLSLKKALGKTNSDTI